MNFEAIEDIYELSSMQQGMLFHSLYAPGAEISLGQVSCDLRGKLNISAFEGAWKQVVQRHQVLRTSFHWEEMEKPVQVVHRQVNIPFDILDWRSMTPAAQEFELDQYLAADRNRGFAMSEAPLLRLGLIRLSDESYKFVFSSSRLLFDGWSGPLIFGEFLAFYEALRKGETIDLKRPRSFGDYIAWLQQQDISKAKGFWRETLKGFSAPTVVGWDRNREAGAVQASGFDQKQIQLSKSVTSDLQAMARHHELTMSTLVQGAWALLLSHYSGEQDVVFGATTSGRSAPLPGIETMVGQFINTLPVRVKTMPESKLVDWLKQIQRQQVESRQYEYTPLVEIQGLSDVPRGVAMFESILVHQNFPEGGGASAAERTLSVSNVTYFDRNNYPLTLASEPGADGLLLKMVYDGGRFQPAEIDGMLRHLAAVLESMASDPARRLWQLELPAEHERRQLLINCNNTEKQYLLDQPIHEMFEAQAERTPESIALLFEQTSLSYRKLNERANQLANHLRALGIGPETAVGISMDRCPEMIVGLLGVLKAGGAYVPLDPAYPPERLVFMLEDSRAIILLTKEEFFDQLPSFWGQVICLDSDWEAIAEASTDNPSSSVTADNLAYIIYTSGSTGVPKGVMLRHRGVCNLAQAQIRAFDVKPDSRVLQFASFSFDASVSEIFTALLSGATLCLGSSAPMLPGPAFIRLLQDQSITVVTLPPSVLALLPRQELPQLRTLVVAGEACPVELVEDWSAGRRFLNAYGPTEGSVCATIAECMGGGQKPAIGLPMDNVKVFILNRYMQPAPFGVAGEIYIGGEGLARGYINRADTTAEQFIPDYLTGAQGARLYKTGDLARRAPSGEIEYMGRLDHQVKIRGYRVELGEVEALLISHPAVRNAAVILREDAPGDKRLVAYVDCGEETAEQLRGFLHEKIPEHMLPSAFVPLEAMPLTTSGKIDRRALPRPDRRRLSSKKTIVMPRDNTELQLLWVWQEILGISTISVTDDFFELGGHSLLAVRLIAQIQKLFKQDLPLSLLSKGATIESLANALRQQTTSIRPSPLVEIQPLGSKRPVFFIHPGSGHVLCYIPWAQHLGNDQPFYGIHDYKIYGEDDPDTPLDIMAAEYIEAIREVQPQGPYTLGGWSFGGLVAFEMAQQLKRKGQEVALLVIVDTKSPPAGMDAGREMDDAKLLAILANEFTRYSIADVNKLAHELRQVDGEERYETAFNYLVDRYKLAGAVNMEYGVQLLRRKMQIFKTRIRVVEEYRPQIYPGKVTLFRAVEEDPELTQLGLSMGWEELSTEEVDVRLIPGNHETMGQEPNLTALIEELRRCLSDSELMMYVRENTVVMQSPATQGNGD